VGPVEGHARSLVGGGQKRITEFSEKRREHRECSGQNLDVGL
jgi:hypothetical protein